MKNLICIILTILILCFLFVTNPTTDEYIEWYTQQTLSELPETMNNSISGLFIAQMAQRAERSDYLFCSVYTYNDHTTVGIAMRFFPVDDLTQQIAMLRSEYAAWLESNTD